jgi:hypothetical protein
MHTPIIKPLALICLVALSGCSFTPPAKLYEGPERPLADIARVKTQDSFEASGNRLSYDWISTVTSIDGKRLGKEGQIRLLPGKYRVGMQCEVNPRFNGKYKTRPVELEVALEAGKHYSPWCQLNATVLSGPGAGLPGAIPGTVVGTVASGYVVPYLSTKDVP